MARYRMTQRISASRRDVWRELADLESHIEWMGDAASIEFTSGQRSGLGTTFDCETRIGPLRTLDRMEVVRWRQGREIAVRHVGLVTGTGTFRLRRGRGGTTVVRWTEQLKFPWYLGGPLAGVAAGPVLRRVWRANLRRLAARCEA